MIIEPIGIVLVIPQLLLTNALELCPCPQGRYMMGTAGKQVIT